VALPFRTVIQQDKVFRPRRDIEVGEAIATGYRGKAKVLIPFNAARYWLGHCTKLINQRAEIVGGALKVRLLITDTNFRSCRYTLPSTAFAYRKFSNPDSEAIANILNGTAIEIKGTDGLISIEEKQTYFTIQSGKTLVRGRDGIPVRVHGPALAIASDRVQVIPLPETTYQLSQQWGDRYVITAPPGVEIYVDGRRVHSGSLVVSPRWVRVVGLKTDGEGSREEVENKIRVRWPYSN